jgi:putative phosphoribosyl transferase
MAAERSVRIPLLDGAVIEGDLAVPDGAAGLIVFAHGSGSSRHSPRNRMVAADLQERPFATLLVDLLTPDEEAVDVRTRHLRFDIDLLADRLSVASAWVRGQPSAERLPIGYFGASTGAAAALVATARQPEGIGAIVSRGGRPDLAGDHLRRVTAPTLLIVGELDDIVIALNQQAAEQLRAPHELVIVAAASHLFEEPGTLEAVARLAGDWFAEHLNGNGSSRTSTG